MVEIMKETANACIWEYKVKAIIARFGCLWKCRVDVTINGKTGLSSSQDWIACCTVAVVLINPWFNQLSVIKSQSYVLYWSIHLPVVLTYGNAMNCYWLIFDDAQFIRMELLAMNTPCIRPSSRSIHTSDL